MVSHSLSLGSDHNQPPATSEQAQIGHTATQPSLARLSQSVTAPIWTNEAQVELINQRCDLPRVSVRDKSDSPSSTSKNSGTSFNVSLLSIRVDRCSWSRVGG